LELTYPGLPKWLWEIPSEHIFGWYVRVDEFYRVRYNSEHMIRPDSEVVHSCDCGIYFFACAIIDKYKKLADNCFDGTYGFWVVVMVMVI
jgi:hypothetical protein